MSLASSCQPSWVWRQHGLLSPRNYWQVPGLHAGGMLTLPKEVQSSGCAAPPAGLGRGKHCKAVTHSLLKGFLLRWEHQHKVVIYIVSVLCSEETFFLTSDLARTGMRPLVLGQFHRLPVRANYGILRVLGTLHLAALARSQY